MSRPHTSKLCLVLAPAVAALLWACDSRREVALEPPSVVTPQITSTDEANNIQIFKNASPSTVFVTNNQLRRDLVTLNVFEIPQGTGTGFVWNREGYVITNSHVVEGASSVSVGLAAGTTRKARLVGLAPAIDIAVLKIDAPPEQLQPLPLGDSNELQVGQKVLAIGNPFGLDFTLTTGIISALGREISAPNGRRIRGVIQTDAAINPGNSGGPLLDSTGRLIGVNTAIIGPGGGSAGIGFAVPINSVAKAVPQIIRHGRVIRPVLGIGVVLDRIARELGITGAIVMNTVPGNGAHRAGIIGVQREPDGRIVIGDVIVRIDDFPVNDSDDLLNALEHYNPGDVVSVKTVRKGEEKTFQVRLSEPE
ncbi:MAG: trypsin-like peptidase domain-containing protein [SAR324 cluster bacterium]|nr:trypsin-like peptidase domain-containing protein [SAR324 cluster bacterium]